MFDSTLKLERLIDVACINVRGDNADAGFQSAVRDTCNVELPVEANTVVGDERKIFWLAPDEWMLVGSDAEMAGIARELTAKLENRHASVNDVSGGQVSYRLRGDNARRLLAKGCTLDLHPDIFGPGQCAQTGLAKAGVLIRPLAGNAGFDLIVRRSFADYLWQWLLRAGREYRIEVT
jgi:sarcosine oxidase subunit gamma